MRVLNAMHPRREEAASEAETKEAGAEEAKKAEEAEEAEEAGENVPAEHTTEPSRREGQGGREAPVWGWSYVGTQGSIPAAAAAAAAATATDQAPGVQDAEERQGRQESQERQTLLSTLAIFNPWLWGGASAAGAGGGGDKGADEALHNRGGAEEGADGTRAEMHACSGAESEGSGLSHSSLNLAQGCCQPQGGGSSGGKEGERDTAGRQGLQDSGGEGSAGRGGLDRGGAGGGGNAGTLIPSSTRPSCTIPSSADVADMLNISDMSNLSDMADVAHGRPPPAILHPDTLRPVVVHHDASAFDSFDTAVPLAHELGSSLPENNDTFLAPLLASPRAGLQPARMSVQTRVEGVVGEVPVGYDELVRKVVRRWMLYTLCLAWDAWRCVCVCVCLCVCVCTLLLPTVLGCSCSMLNCQKEPAYVAKRGLIMSKRGLLMSKRDLLMSKMGLLLH